MTRVEKYLNRVCADAERLSQVFDHSDDSPIVSRLAESYDALKSLLAASAAAPQDGAPLAAEIKNQADLVKDLAQLGRSYVKARFGPSSPEYATAFGIDVNAAKVEEPKSRDSLARTELRKAKRALTALAKELETRHRAIRCLKPCLEQAKKRVAVAGPFMVTQTRTDLDTLVFLFKEQEERCQAIVKAQPVAARNMRKAEANLAAIGKGRGNGRASYRK